MNLSPYFFQFKIPFLIIIIIIIFLFTLTLYLSQAAHHHRTTVTTPSLGTLPLFLSQMLEHFLVKILVNIFRNFFYNKYYFSLTFHFHSYVFLSINFFSLVLEFQQSFSNPFQVFFFFWYKQMNGPCCISREKK